MRAMRDGVGGRPSNRSPSEPETRGCLPGLWRRRPIQGCDSVARVFQRRGLLLWRHPRRYFSQRQPAEAGSVQCLRRPVRCPLAGVEVFADHLLVACGTVHRRPGHRAGQRHFFPVNVGVIKSLCHWPRQDCNAGAADGGGAASSRNRTWLRRAGSRSSGRR